MIELRGKDIPEYEISKKVYFIILVFSFLWLLMIFLTPLLQHAGGFPEKLSDFGYLFFSKVCHQQEERSFHLFESKLGVCSRCVFIYAGFFLGTAYYPLKYRLSNIYPPSVWILIAAVLLLSIDVVLDNTGIIPNSFLSRSVTGSIIGFVLPLYIIPGFVKFFCEIFSFLRNKFSI